MLLALSSKALFFANKYGWKVHPLCSSSFCSAESAVDAAAADVYQSFCLVPRLQLNAELGKEGSNSV